MASGIRSEPGRVASVHVRDGLAVGCAGDGVWCAGENRADIPIPSGARWGERRRMARRVGLGLVWTT